MRRHRSPKKMGELITRFLKISSCAVILNFCCSLSPKIKLEDPRKKNVWENCPIRLLAKKTIKPSPYTLPKDIIYTYIYIYINVSWLYIYIYINPQNPSTINHLHFRQARGSCFPRLLHPNSQRGSAKRLLDLPVKICWIPVAEVNLIPGGCQ